MSVSSVTQFVTAFYNQYAACHGGKGGPTCTSSVVNEYGTANLDSYYTPAAGYSYNADPITCSQNLPSGVEVSDVTLTPNQASGTVTEDFTPSITTMFVVVDQSGTLKIDTITCNPPAVALIKPGGSGTGSTGGSGMSLDGTYTISLPPGDDGCGTPSLSAETLTINGTTASITAVNGQTPFHGTATTTGSTFSMHITNGISNAPGAITIDLTGSIQPNGDLSGESANGGVYPGGTNGFACNYPFAATRTSATGPSSPVTTPPTGQPTGPLQLATGGEFRSPTGNLGCEIDYGNAGNADRVYCQSFSPPQSVTMSADGSFKTCTGTNCIGNPGQGTPTLSYGATATGGPFSCVSAASGITCTASGKGFEISRTGVTAVP
jgi:hypothetical protein